MKCLLLFALVLVGVLTKSTEGCMSEAHNTNNHKSDNSNEAPDDEHNATTVKSVPETNAAHTFSIIPAKSVVVVATEKPAIALGSETINKTAVPEMIHFTPLTATLVISTNNTADRIQPTETTTVKPTTTASTITTQKPALVFAETTNKAAPIAIAALIITATPMVEEVNTMKPALLNATDKPASNVSVETVGKPAVTTAMPMKSTTGAPAEHSTEKAAVQVVQEMTKLTTVATTTMNSTGKPAVVTVEMMPSTAVPAISTAKPIHVTEEMMNKTAEFTTVKTTSSVPTVVTAVPTTIRREKRQADNQTTKKPEMTTKNPVATTKKSIPTTKKPLVPTTPVFGRRVSTRAPIPVTRRARQGTTVRPGVTASRASTSKPVNPTTKQPVKLSPMPSNVHTPVTMKPHPVATGSVTPKA